MSNIVRLLTAACLTSGALVGLASQESFAADMGAPVYKAAPPVRPACAQFGGFYVGGNVGANYYTHDWKDQANLGGLFGGAIAPGLNATEGTNSKAGWNAGGQLGWNYQAGCTVWGVVTDWNWASTKADAFYQSFPGGALGPFVPSTLSATSELNWFGTARTRAGVVVDNLLLYVTGGFAFANFDRTLAYTANPFPFGARAATVTDSSTRVGFAVGAGTEWNLGNNWSFGSEFLYLGFQKDELSFTCSAGGVGSSCPALTPARTYNFTFNDSVWVARFNLNYRFGDYGKAPVVAKY